MTKPLTVVVEDVLERRLPGGILGRTHRYVPRSMQTDDYPGRFGAVDRLEIRFEPFDLRAAAGQPEAKL